MKSISNCIYSFEDIEEYNDYAKRKYTNPLLISDIDQNIAKQFTSENEYLILAVVVKPTSEQECVIENDIFRSSDKGFVLGTLNQDRSQLINKILRIVIDDGKLVLLLDKKNFKSFEIGLLIDPKFDERGSSTITSFLSMVSD